jgi:hypothetical protein
VAILGCCTQCFSDGFVNEFTTTTGAEFTVDVAFIGDLGDFHVFVKDPLTGEMPLSVAYAPLNPDNHIASHSAMLTCGTYEYRIRPFMIREQGTPPGTIDKRGFAVFNWRIRPLTPLDFVEDLRKTLISFELGKSVSQPLDSYLQDAIQVLTDSSQKNDLAAVKALSDFIGSVIKQSGRSLSAAQANVLSSKAQVTIDQFNCQ